MKGPWPASAGFGASGLTVAGVPAAELAERFGTPLVVIDEDHVRARCREFAGAFDRVLWAVKAFPAGGLIRIALEEGLGLLAATGGELEACLRAGATPDRIVFHGNNKLEAEIERAVGAGVSLIVVDNEEEVGRIGEAARAAGVRQPVLLRIVPGLDVQTHAHVATGMRDTKFGIPLPLALQALKRALEQPELEVRGVHMHLGSQLLDTDPYRGALEVALGFLQEAADRLGFQAQVLDLGGGMGVRYREEEPVSPASLGAELRGLVERGSADRGLEAPTLLVEPGRALVSNAALTLYGVGTIKEIPGVRTYVAVDGGMSDNLRPVLYDARYTFGLASRVSDADEAPVTIVGRHCESGDVLGRDVSLPRDVRRGDLLAVASTGAYEYAMASNYNKVGRPAVVMVSGGEPRLILRREDEADLSRLERPPPRAAARPEAVIPGIEIRPARARDAREVLRLVAGVAAEGLFIRTEAPGWPRAEVRRRLRSSWTRDQAEIVAVAEGRVVGHLGLTRDRDRPTRHVASLGMVVARDLRGRRIGTALMQRAFAWARWAGVEKLALSVFPHNEAALALYRRFGFVEEGRLIGHTKKSSGYEDEVVMGAWV